MFNVKNKNQPIYLESLSIAGIKCFGPEQTIKFSDKGKPKMWTMILGDNGTGKTTILKSIAWALSRDVLSDKMADSNEFKSFNFILNEFTRNDVEDGLLVLEAIGFKELNELSYSHYNGVFIRVYAPDVGKNNVPIFAYGSYRRLGTKGLSNGELPFQFASLFDESAELINAEDWLLSWRVS